MQMANPNIPDYSNARLCPESWQMYFEQAHAYSEAAFTLTMAGLHGDAKALLEKAVACNKTCRENFDSRT